MKPTGIHEIRKAYLDFFESKDHLVHESYSLVPPAADKSLLLINAGMAPLKDYFLKIEEPPRHRMTTCQKCIRTGDIDNVGKTDRHGTFFEMLGNFSFQDYFKKEAIEYAWEFMTGVMGVAPEKLWVSVYLEDDEAFDLWNQHIGVPKERIVRLGKEDNFWEMTVGPCGPCSEIYIDRGEHRGCGSKDCKPGCDCDRFVEVWNLVFSEFDKDENGNYTKLAEPNIDTGMGLERMAIVMTDANNIFEVEPVATILRAVEKLSDFNYGDTKKTDVSIRIITDHIRAMSFLIADGVLPSNEGRGYVLRRIIRRAHQHGRQLGISTNFLPELVDVVVENWGEVYPELLERKEQVKKVVSVEANKFDETIEQGNQILDKKLNDLMLLGTKQLSGEDAFKLYDTYGFPFELTLEILSERGFDVKIEDFKEEMEKQRERARNARSDAENSGWDKSQLGALMAKRIFETVFRGYDAYKLDTEIESILIDGEEVDQVSSGQDCMLILKETPFYGESGGQIGDIGTITKDGNTLQVTDSKKGPNGIVLHHGKVLEGSFKINDEVHARIERSRRKDIARNHSCTHLLHQALKDVLGEHVVQKGSLVTENRARFDFSHFEGMTDEELRRVEALVNEKILEGLAVIIREVPIAEAREMGAQALFGEKYGDVVRVVKMGDYSIELCGGTHVTNTNDIGMFKIISESGVASGVRRIEAVTGREVYQYMSQLENMVTETASIFKSNKKDLVDKAHQVTEEMKELKREIEKLNSKLMSIESESIYEEVKQINGCNVLLKDFDGMEVNAMRDLGDKIKDKLGSVVLVFVSKESEKVSIMISATKDLVGKGVHSGKIIKEVAAILGGNGGGRPDMAQAGAKDATKVKEALDKAEALIREVL